MHLTKYSFWSDTLASESARKKLSQSAHWLYGGGRHWYLGNGSLFYSGFPLIQHTKCHNLEMSKAWFLKWMNKVLPTHHDMVHIIGMRGLSKYHGMLPRYEQWTPCQHWLAAVSCGILPCRQLTLLQHTLSPLPSSPFLPLVALQGWWRKVGTGSLTSFLISRTRV